MPEDELQKLIQEVLITLESTTIFIVPPHYERWEDGFKSLDEVRRGLTATRVRLEGVEGVPAWLLGDLAGIQVILNDFVKLRDDFYRQFPYGGDSHSWSSLAAAERQLEDLQRRVGRLRDTIRSHASLSMSQGSSNASRRTQQLLAYCFGVAFVVVLLAFAKLDPLPTPFQYLVFRVVLGLAAAGVAATIPGFIEFNIPNYLRAGGALAVFAIVYFANPGKLIDDDPPTPKLESKFIDVSTDKDQTLSAIVDAVKQKQNITITFDESCGPNIRATMIEKGEFQGKDVQDFLDNLRQRSKGSEPTYHVVLKGDSRYEILCP